MKLLFFSYTKSRSFFGVLNNEMSSFTKIVMINTSLSTNSPLVQFNEVAGLPGAMYCYQQNTGNIIVLDIKADKILVQEIKSPAKSSKIHSALCHYDPIADKETSSGKKNVATTMLLLLDDGSVQAYNGNMSSDFTIAERPLLSSSKNV